MGNFAIGARRRGVLLGVGVFLAVMALVEDPPWVRARPRSVDYIGLGLIALGLGCLQLTLDRG